MEDPTIALFCCLDDFAQLFEDREHHHLLPSSRQRWRHGKLSLGEMLFIMVLFHISPYKTRVSDKEMGEGEAWWPGAALW